MQKSNQWRHKIEIKHLFEDEPTPELLIKLSDLLISELTKIKNVEETGNLSEDYKDTVLEILENNIFDFKFVKQICDGSIPKSCWCDCNFDGNYKSLFNAELNTLYDVCDERVETTNNVSYKFIFIY